MPTSKEMLEEEYENELHCPDCGCTRFTKIDEINLWGNEKSKMIQYRCDNQFCGYVWLHNDKTEEQVQNEDGSYDYVKNRCPHCGSKDQKITRKIGKVRYHKCKNKECNKNFKTREYQ